VGDRLTEEDKPKQTSPYPYGDIFDELFPHYLLMGMTPEQYWDGESGLKKAFREAYRMRMDYEQKLADRNNWYMGQYIMCVLQCVPLLVGGLNVKPSTQLPEYPDKPFLEKAEAEKRETDRKRHEEDQMKLAMAMFQSAVLQKNKQLEKNAKPVSAGQ
jgi:hypothetical protein